MTSRRTEASHSAPLDQDPAVHAARSTVASLFAAQACAFPERVAIEVGALALNYRQLDERVRRLATALHDAGVALGDRVAFLSENRAECLEVILAAAHLGAVVACQNWRLTTAELSHCISLVEPKLIFVSPRQQESLRAALGAGSGRVVAFGSPYESLINASLPHEGPQRIDPESALLILYTSGTTGLPKGAVISHRAQIFRNLVVRAEFGVEPEHAFVAWSPLYHMGAVDCALGALMSGSKVIVVDGFERAALAQIVGSERLGWLLLMPGMISEFASELEARKGEVCGVQVCGVMADLVPADEIARITSLLQAPYANTFGSTETGCPPCSSSLLAIGARPRALFKRQSPFCEVRLVDGQDRDVPVGTPGELCMRGPTLFSGYWSAPEANAESFRGGWFHMGDVFVRQPDGSLDFVDRVKYLIKSGGENIYPAEIERVLLGVDGVLDAAVVRCADPKWGEVPIAFVACRDSTVAEEELRRRCRSELAGFKQPKGFRFVALAEFPRSASGKVVRHELEKRLERESLPPEVG